MPPGDLDSHEPPLETELHLCQILLLLQRLEWLWSERQDFYASTNSPFTLLVEFTPGGIEELFYKYRIGAQTEGSRYLVEAREIHDTEYGISSLNLVRALEPLIPVGQRYILVDINDWSHTLFKGRQAIPFLEKDGMYWGLPSDDATAIQELERLRDEGASAIVFGWPAFWCLDHYSQFSNYLQNHFHCTLNNGEFVVFDLS